MAGREDFVNSIIGEGARFSGEIELTGLLRIDGDFSGAVWNADRVLVGKTGRVKSSISSRVVVIGGAVMGDVVAKERITLLSTAIVIGTLKAPLLSIEEGVIFHGACDVIVENEEVGSPQKSTQFKVDWQTVSTEL
jgi:cytoskeletal protein CcmA (bactofilin family)